MPNYLEIFEFNFVIYFAPFCLQLLLKTKQHQKQDHFENHFMLLFFGGGSFSTCSAPFAD